MGRKYVRLTSLYDLVVMAVALEFPVIHFYRHEGQNIYFIPFFHIGDGVVYYVLRREEVHARFIVFNKMTGDVSFSDKPETDTRFVLLPIISIEKQNIIDMKSLVPKPRKRGERG